MTVSTFKCLPFFSLLVPLQYFTSGDWLRALLELKRKHFNGLLSTKNAFVYDNNSPPTFRVRISPGAFLELLSLQGNFVASKPPIVT